MIIYSIMFIVCLVWLIVLTKRDTKGKLESWDIYPLFIVSVFWPLIAVVLVIRLVCHSIVLVVNKL